MKRKSLWIGAVAIVILAAASAVAVETLGGNGPAQDVVIIRNPPGGSECLCPAIWDPVVCTAPDGTRGAFSNSCVAGCYGFTHCAEIVPQPLP